MTHNLKTISATLVRLGLTKCNYTFKDLTQINSEVEATIKEFQGLLFDKEHLTNCASCKVGIWCNAPIIGKMILGLTEEECTELIKKVMGDEYPVKGENSQ